MTILTKLIFLLLLNCTSVFALVNHAPLDPRHVKVAENFLARNLKSGDQYDLIKIDDFIHRLEKDLDALHSDVYENTIIESIDIRLDTIEQARENAAREVKDDRNAHIKVYKKYIFPMIRQIRQMVSEGHELDLVEEKVDRFIEYYHIFFSPENPRNAWAYDVNAFQNITPLFGYTRSKNVNTVEANNLVAGKYIENVSLCLGSDSISKNSPLTQDQLQSLKNCDFDISKLDPAPNPFFKNLTSKQKLKAKTEFLDYFPNTDEELKFEFMIYSGIGSPKFVASAIKEINGEKRRLTFKIKTGTEIHADPTSSMLGKLLGLNQDHGKHVARLKINLGKMSVDEFTARFRRKYKSKLRDLAPFIVAKSPSYSKENWIVLKDLSLEVRDPKKLYLSPYDPWGWDLPNRREHRAIMLWFGFIAARDLKPGNHSVNIKETANGPVLEYSPQDVGLSLANQTDTRFPLRSVFFRDGKAVNHFNSTFLSWGQNHVKVHWSDAGVNQIKYTSTTYNDLKWMARKIAKLTMDDYDYALRIGGHPAAARDLYKIKFGMRRNEIIKAFNLEDEFKLWTLPNLNTYSPNKYIRNGKIIVDGFEGHVHFQGSTNMSVTSRNLIDLIITNVPLEKMYKGFTASINRGLSITSDIAMIDLKDNPAGKVFKFDKFIGGIKFNVSRKIIYNNALYAQAPNNMGRYIVKDTIKVGLAIEADRKFNIFKALPLEISPEITLFERKYEHMQVASNWKQAIKSPVKVFKFLTTPMASFYKRLENGDVFLIQDKTGFQFNANVAVNLTQTPFLTLDTQAGIGYFKTRPLYIYKDEVGDVLIFREQKKDLSFNTSAQLLPVDVFLLNEFPILGISYTFNRIKDTSELFKFEVGNPSANRFFRLRQEEELEAFFNDKNPLLYMKNRVLDIKAHGIMSKFKADFLFFFHTKKENSFYKIQTSIHGVEKNFIRYQSSTDNFIGEKYISSFIPKGEWFFTKKRKQNRISIELEQGNIETAMATMEFQDYRSKLSKQNLLNFITWINYRFSPSDTSPILKSDHLPPEWEVRNYYKVLSYMRVQIGIGKFIQNIDSVNYRKIRKNIMSHSRDLGLKLPRVFLSLIKKGIRQIKANRNRPEKQVKAIARILNYIDKQKRGTRLLKELVGVENIFVYGDILGVYPSYSRTQELEGVSSRKYGAKSWGELTGTPPLRQFLLRNLVAPIYLHILTDDISSEIFGKLPTTNGQFIY